MSNLIGTSPEQVPANCMLGEMAYQDKAGVDLRHTFSGADGSGGNFVVVTGGAQTYHITMAQSGKFFRSAATGVVAFDLPSNPLGSTTPPPAGTNVVVFGHETYANTVTCDGGVVGIILPDGTDVDKVTIPVGLGNEVAFFYDGANRWRVIVFGGPPISLSTLGDDTVAITDVQVARQEATITPSTARTKQLPTAAALLPLIGGESLLFTIVNTAAHDVTISVNTNVTITGSPTVNNSSATWRVRRLTATTIRFTRL